MPKLDRGDVSLHYKISGTGPPLLMLAGMLSDSAIWAPLFPLLEPHFTLIRPDNRTTGRTTPWNAPAALDLVADDARALLDHLEIPHAHVLGHSMGGLIGLLLAQNHPARIASLTTAATASMRMSRNVALFQTLVAIRRSNAPADTWLRALFPWLFATSLFDTPEAIDEATKASLEYPFAQSTDAMAHQIDALAAFDPSALSQPPETPVQCLLAGSDLLIPLKDAQTALNGYPQHVIEHAGHSIHWDAPKQFADHLFAFTQSNPIKGTA
ncbi:MAG: alpha/beta fold hydrolase [Ascidiaceihabitans sp.]|nr:alpha/beta fold hydrolase [Ascidiaceihabitans sp.]